MVTALRLVALTIAAACLLLIGAWIWADRRAPRLVGDALHMIDADTLVEVGAARLSSPDTVILHDVVLKDPLDGEKVAQVDEVEARFALVDGVPLPVHFTARGGRVSLQRRGDDVSFVRALAELIDRIAGAIEAAKGPPPVDASGKPEPPHAWYGPGIEATGITLVLEVPGRPIEVIEDVSAWIAISSAEGVKVAISPGPTGLVLLEFGDDGLDAVRISNLPVNPTHMVMLGAEAGAVLDELQPSGVLDLDLRFSHEGGTMVPRARGVLRGARLQTSHVPFPVVGERIPFEIDGDSFHVDSARVAVPGGFADVGVDHSEGRTRLQVDSTDLPFRAEQLLLIPYSEGVKSVQCEDGGNVDVHLVIDMDADGVHVTGDGGVLIERLTLGEFGWPVRDLVGSFRLKDGRLEMPELSGRCAGGVMRVRGAVELESGEMDVRFEALDVDVEQLGLERYGDHSRASGWLQGNLRWVGVLGQPGRGDGQFSVRGGNLWDFPVLDEVFGALGLVKPGSSERHRLQVEFKLRKRVTYIDSLLIESDVVTLRGSGKINNPDRLDIEIIPIRLPVALLGDLLEYIQGQLLRVELRGTLTKPEVKLTPLKFVTEPVGGFLGWVGRLFTGAEETVEVVPQEEGTAPAAPAAPTDGAAPTEEVAPAEGAAPAGG